MTQCLTCTRYSLLSHCILAGMGRAGSISDSDCQLYAAQMEQVKARISAAQLFLEQGLTYPLVESAALQIRSAIETVALSSLVANRHQLEIASRALMRKDYDAAIKLVRRLNPNFWPQPSTQRLNEQGRPVEIVPVIEGFLTEVNQPKVWGKLSSWLHARNPYSPLPEPAVGATLVRDTIEQLVTLLNHHTVELIGRNEMLACLMADKDDGIVHVAVFERLPGD